MMTAIPAKNLSFWDVPPLFTNTVDGFNKIAKLGKSAIKVAGIFCDHLGQWLKPLGSALGTVTGYVSATKLFANITAWFPNADGKVPAFSTKGNPWFKGLATLSFQLLDTLSALDFFSETLKLFDLGKISEGLGKIPVIGPLFQSKLNPLKSVFGLAAAAFSVGDMACQVHKTLNKMGKEGVYLDLASGFTAKGWFKMTKDTPEAHKVKEEARISFREVGMGCIMTALKVCQSVLMLLGFALSPVVALLALAFDLLTVSATISKASDKAAVENDPKYAQAWSLAEKLPSR